MQSNDIERVIDEVLQQSQDKLDAKQKVVEFIAEVDKIHRDEGNDDSGIYMLA